MGNISPKDLKWLQWTNHGAQLFSTCGKRQYMAIIVDRLGFQAASGYNGVPSGMTHCKDGGCPRLLNNTPAGSGGYTDCFSAHAEQNCLMQSDHTRCYLGTMYVNGMPCWTCSKSIATSVLNRIVCVGDESYEDWERSIEFMKAAGKRVLVVDRSVVDSPIGGTFLGEPRPHLQG